VKGLRKRKPLSFGFIILLILVNYPPLSIFVKPTEPQLAAENENYENVYTIFQTGILARRLYVSIPPSLYHYYRGRSRGLYDVTGYNKFITPEAVEPIAKELRKLFTDDEQFANAVLSLVHGMKYIKSGPKYPVETLVENAGDCSALSFLAASIMMAGKLDVVLLRYSGASIEHLNVGVYLPRAPIYHTWWMSPKGFEYKGKKYWIAECTPSWVNWRVGDEPGCLQGTNVRVIPVKPADESPSCISASLDFPLNPSTISIDLPPQTLIKRDIYNVKISGTICPEKAGVKVVAYMSRNGFFWDFSAAGYTDEHGRYILTCNLSYPGVYYVRVSRNGCEGYSGADSSTLIFFVGPGSLTKFRGPGFNYTYGPIGLYAYEINRGIGTDEFLSLRLVGDRILITGEFMLLKGEFNTTSEDLVSPQNLWGLQPIRLPNDFNLQVRDTFAIIIDKHDGNISLRVVGLNRYDTLNMSQLSHEEALVLNASSSVMGNHWHSLLLGINGNVTTFQLYGENGTTLVSQTYNSTAKAFVFIISNIKNSLVVFKNLRIETFDGSLKPVENYFTPGFPLFYMVLFMSIVVLMLVTVTVSVYKKRAKLNVQTLKFTHCTIHFNGA
jgi:hypothetical protein